MPARRPGGTSRRGLGRFRAAAAVTVWTGAAKALRAHPPLGQRSPPLAASAAARGGRARSMSATDPVAFGWGRLRPLGGNRRRATARQLKAAEMQPKTSGSDASGAAAGGGGGGALVWGGGGGKVLRRGRRPCRARGISEARGQRPGVVPPDRWWGGERVSIPPPLAYWPLIYRAPPVSQEVKRWPFWVSGVVRPQCRGGAGAQRRGGGRAPARCRGARGRADLRGRAGLSKPGRQRRRSCSPVLGDEHLAARREPGRDPRAARACRGVSVSFMACPTATADAPAQASAPGARRRPMFQAERALSATARPWWATALPGSKQDAAGWRPWGPPGIWQ